MSDPLNWEIDFDFDFDSFVRRAGEAKLCVCVNIIMIESDIIIKVP